MSVEKMPPEHFATLIQLLTNNNAVTVSFNVPVEDNYGNVHEVLIHESNAALIHELVQHGFSCRMTAKGLSIDHY